jgi:hypothetical protein
MEIFLQFTKTEKKISFVCQLSETKQLNYYFLPVLQLFFGNVHFQISFNFFQSKKKI